jgi:hypothetical protein
VGHLCLEAGEIGQAWTFYRLLNEPAPVVAAIEQGTFTEPEQVQEVLQIALNEGVHPKKGFDLVVEHHGLCSAITMLSGQFPFSGEVREHCIRRLVYAMYAELRERLRADIASREGAAPPESSISEMLHGREDLTNEDAYHVDVSHLAAVVQFAIELPAGEEMRLALEMCEYGRRLSPRLRYSSAPPFEDSYADLRLYFRTLLGQDVETGLEHFRAKAEAAGEGETAPAEVYIHLLATLGRTAAALQAYNQFLAQADPRGLACPSPQDLCHKLGDYQPLAELSLRRGDWVNYAAAMLQQRKMNG